ncbi:Potassium channel [Cystobasidiomycetes sp. EMM_F5]
MIPGTIEITGSDKAGSTSIPDSPEKTFSYDGQLEEKSKGRSKPWKAWRRTRIKSDTASTVITDNESEIGTIAEPTKVKTRWTPVLLEIPGLTALWYVRLASANSEVVETQPNPIVLDVALAISMALGAIANIALIVRFLERYCYAATIIAMVCNTTVVTVFGVVHRVSDGFDYSSAFWLTVASSAASVACNITLIYDFVRTKDFRHNGALIFDEVMGIPFEAALYFVIVSCATVGFGDIVPNNLASRLLTFFYTSGGIVLLAVTIAQAREVLIESFATAYRHRRKLLVSKAKERRARKKAEYERRRQLARLNNTESDSKEHLTTKVVTTSGRGGAGRSSRAKTVVGAGSSAGKMFIARVKQRITAWNSEDAVDSTSLERADTISLADADGYKILKQRIHAEQKREFRVKLACYGDFAPISQAGRSFFVAWSLFGVANLTLLFSVLTESWSLKYKSSIEKSKVKRALKRFKVPGRSGSVFAMPNDVAMPTEQPLTAQPLAPVDLVQRLADAAKGFDEHAKYFLDSLVDVADQVKQALLDKQDEIQKLRAEVERLKSTIQDGRKNMLSLMRNDTMSSFTSSESEMDSDYDVFGASPTSPLRHLPAMSDAERIAMAYHASHPSGLRTPGEMTAFRWPPDAVASETTTNPQTPHAVVHARSPDERGTPTGSVILSTPRARNEPRRTITWDDTL